MNFEFSEEQDLLRDSVRRYLDDQCGRDQARTVLESDQPFAAAVWDEMAEMGWTGTAVAEDAGGVGMGHLELCVIAEELGRCLAPVPFASSVYLAIEALMLAGSQKQRAEWLPQLASGALIGTVAATEKAGPLCADAIEAQYANGVISGTKMPVLDGNTAGIAVVLARQDQGLSLFLVNLQSDRVRSESIDSIDPSRDVARLVLDRAPAQLLGQAGQGVPLLDRLFDRAAVLIAFEQLGSAQAAMDMAVAYARDRYAFGRPIGSFQAIKHRLADMFVAVELARSNCYYGAWALSNDAPELPLAAAASRIAAIQADRYCSKENIQVHGGMGFTWEADCHLFYRRAKLQSLLLGSERVWKDKLVDQLQRRSDHAAVAQGLDAA